jgi:Rieske Fe-S protein
MLGACGVEPIHTPDMAMHDMKKADLESGPDMAGPVEVVATFANYPALMTAGHGVTVYAPNGKPIVIVRTGATTAAGIDGTCTHQGCTVAYNQTNNNLQCPCHGSKYSLAGVVIMGPATMNLKVYPAVISQTAITVTLM